ncbi:MAG: DUF4011 domain-containing protein, partial [Methanomassiliicoccaceae archaeon]|nr:DUF4011 domain-containing protein [Methanomassiliicoccaceae archaeon]
MRGRRAFGMGLRLDAAVSLAVGHATQDHIPVIKSLAISNDSDDIVENIRIIIRSEPQFSKTKAINVKSIGPREKAGIKNADVSLIPEFLSEVTERIDGHIVVSAEKGGRPIFENRYEIKILARNEWPGAAVPETAVKFVTQDDPEVLRVAANAAKFLDAWTGDAAIDRYVSGDRSKVRREVGAVYAAVQQFDIRRTETKDIMKNGCKVSSAEILIDRGSGTSFDLTLLFLSCAGSIGLNTVLVLTRKRAVAGVWLDDTTFPGSVQSDITSLMRAVRDGSLMLVDCDGVTSNNKMDIESSETSAKRLLLNESDFLSAVDVRRLRGTAPAQTKKLREKMTVEKKNVTAGSQAIHDPKGMARDDENELTKRELWEGRLLDLSFDNELLSMKMTHTLLPVMTNNLTALKDALSSGDEFDVLGKPAEWDNHILNEAPFELSRYIGRHEVLVEQEFRHRHLRSPYSERDVNRRLAKIHDICVTDKEKCENSVFIVLGLLKWFDTDGKIIYSPLILMPAETVMRSVNDTIRIRAKDDEAVINKTLLEKLKRTRDLDVSLDPLPSDRTGADTESVFEIMSDAIRAMDGWDIIKGAFIGVFRPERYDVWNDLRGRSASLFSNKLTKSLMEGRLTWPQDPVNDADLYKKMMLVFPAENEQLKVLKAASSGRTFILDCPSNSGRRRTISNIIANAVYQNKTVLYVSENDGTLRSMKRSLDDAGIGKFCLYLNSGSANKQKVLEHFRNVFDSASSSYVEDFSLRADGIEKMCTELSAPVRAIHKRTNMGRSIHELVIQYDSVRSEKIKNIDIPDALIDTITPDSAVRWEGMVKDLIAAGKALGHPSKNPLSDTGISEYDNKTGLRITERLKEWIAAAEDTEKASDLLVSSVAPDRMHGATELASLLISLNDLPKGMLGTDDLTAMNLRLHDLLKVLRRTFEMVSNISETLSPDTTEESIEILKKQREHIALTLERLDSVRLPINIGIIEAYMAELLSVENSMVRLFKLLNDVRTEWHDSILSVSMEDLIHRWMDISGRRLFAGNAKRMFMFELAEHLKNSFVTFDGVPNALRYVEDHGTQTEHVKRSLEAVDVLSGGTYEQLGDECRSLETLYLETLKKIESLRSYGDPDKLCRKYSETSEVQRYASELASAAGRSENERKAVEYLLDTDISKITKNDDIKEWKELSKKWLNNIKGFKNAVQWNKCRKELE